LLLLSFLGGLTVVSTDGSPWKSKQKMTNTKPFDGLFGGSLFWHLARVYRPHLQDDWIWKSGQGVCQVNGRWTKQTGQLLHSKKWETCKWTGMRGNL
jgi:hypothetical protein